MQEREYARSRAATLSVFLCPPAVHPGREEARGDHPRRRRGRERGWDAAATFCGRPPPAIQLVAFPSSGELAGAVHLPEPIRLLCSTRKVGGRRREPVRPGPVDGVRCGSCGSTFSLSVRREYQYRVEGCEPTCAECRRPPHKPPDTADYLYWISRFSYDEIVEIATGMAS